MKKHFYCFSSVCFFNSLEKAERQESWNKDHNYTLMDLVFLKLASHHHFPLKKVLSLYKKKWFWVLSPILKQHNQHLVLWLLPASIGQVLFSFTGAHSEYFMKHYSPNCLKASEYNSWPIAHDVCSRILFHFTYIKHIL